MFCCGALSTFALAPEFGRLPQGGRLERIRQSPNYANGEFHNQIPTSMFAEDKSQTSVMWEFLFKNKDNLKPSSALPMLKTDLKTLDGDGDVAIWLGHSSSFLRIGGKHILIDPVFNSHAAPFPFMVRAFMGEYPYNAESIPEIDCLIISHDHWDHLDYPSLTALKTKIKAVVCPLGVGAHLELWGFDPQIIHEADWNENLRLEKDFNVHVLPARHFSGRWLRGNRTLWAGFLLETSTRRVFYSGDSGYGPHFARIGEKFGPIDLAIMENGQYDENWKYIHMMPEEAVQAAEDLRAAALLPAHSGRFSICNHAWNDPYKRIFSASLDKKLKLLTPMIGEIVRLDDPNQSFNVWWEQ